MPLEALFEYGINDLNNRLPVASMPSHRATVALNGLNSSTTYKYRLKLIDGAKAVVRQEGSITTLPAGSKPASRANSDVQNELTSLKIQLLQIHLDILLQGLTP